MHVGQVYLPCPIPRWRSSSSAVDRESFVTVGACNWLSSYRFPCVFVRFGLVFGVVRLICVGFMEVVNIAVPELFSMLPCDEF